MQSSPLMLTEESNRTYEGGTAWPKDPGHCGYFVKEKRNYRSLTLSTQVPRAALGFKRVALQSQAHFCNIWAAVGPVPVPAGNRGDDNRIS